MISKLVSILVGPLTKEIGDVAKTWINKEVSEDEMLADVNRAVSTAVAGMDESAAKVLVAEAQGESWLQRNWRPLTGASLGFTMFFWAVLVPLAVGWVGLPPLSVGDTLLSWVYTALISFGTVYAGGRSLEKISKNVMDGIK